MRLRCSSAPVLVCLQDVVALLVCILGVSAWDKDGHEAIGMTAMSALEGPAVQQVKHLMGGRDAVDVAAWAHKVNKKYPWTVPLHFQPQPTDKCDRADMSVCPDNKCLVKTMKHLYGRLVGQELATIEWPAEMKLTDADCVKYLINLIGDLHQPMHLGLQSEDMGRNVTVLFRGKTMSLFDFWDHEMTQAVMTDTPGFWWGGWTHVQRTRVEYEQDGAKWKKDGVIAFDQWADETVKFRCDKISINPLTARSLGADSHGGPIRVDAALFETWKREMLSRLLVAGARTAIVLNDLLQHREVGHELHAGTAVSGLEGDEDEEKVPHLGRKGDVGNGHAQEGLAAAGMNLGVFLVVGVVFLQVMRMWQGRDAVNQADRAKQKGGDGGKKT